MTEATGEKKPAQSGCDEKPFISEEMLHAGWMKLYGLQGVDCANSLAEEVYTAMAGARPLALRQAEMACLKAPSAPADASIPL